MGRKWSERPGLAITSCFAAAHHRSGGCASIACNLSVGRVSEGRRPHVLRTVSQRRLSNHCPTARTRPEGRSSGGPSRRATKQVRAGHQSKNRGCTWPCDFARSPRSGRRGDRIVDERPLLPQSGHAEKRNLSNVATSLLHDHGSTDRYPVIEICDVLVPHPETTG